MMTQRCQWKYKHVAAYVVDQISTILKWFIRENNWIILKHKYNTYVKFYRNFIYKIYTKLDYFLMKIIRYKLYN